MSKKRTPEEQAKINAQLAKAREAKAQKKKAEDAATSGADTASTNSQESIKEVNATVERKPGDVRRVEVTRRKKLIKKYKEEPRVAISISPLYKPLVGKVMPMYLNGIFVAVPADGGRYLVPQSFADMWEERRIKLDYMIKKAQGMQDVEKNLEKQPGELTI